MITPGELLFYLFALIAIVGTAAAIFGRQPVHGLIALAVSFLANAGVFFLIGAPLAAMLEIIVYAGAIVVLLVFVVMLLNISAIGSEKREVYIGAVEWRARLIWVAIVAGALGFGVVASVPGDASLANAAWTMIPPKEVALALYRDFPLTVELASMLLLAGLVGAFHLGVRRSTIPMVDRPEPGDPV